MRVAAEHTANIDRPNQSFEMQAMRPEQEAIQPPAEPADGGKKAWLGVFGSFMVFVNIWGFVFIFGVFQSFYELDYLSSDSPSAIAWVGTIQSALLSLIGVFAGPLFDLGAFRLMAVSGALLVLLGLFMLSLSTSYYQILLSQGVCVGIGGGLLYVPTLTLVSKSFYKRRTLAMGILTCGIGIGSVVYIAAFQSLLPQLGFRWTVRVLAFMAAGIFGMAIPALIYSSPTHVRSSSRRKMFDVAAFEDPLFLTYSLSSFLIFLGYLVPFFYIPSFGQTVLGMSASSSFWALAISGATSIVGRLASAIVAQRIGIMAAWVSCAAISAILCLCWIAIHSTAPFYAFCALYGCFSGALVALPPSIFPRVCKDPSLLGTWMGMSWCFAGVSFLIGAPIAGALSKIGATGAGGLSFLPVQLWSGLLLGAGTASLATLWALLVKRDRASHALRSE